jgi:hypothetical protein
MSGSVTLKINPGASGRAGGGRRFLGHFGEMLLAMFLGMVVLGGVAELGYDVDIEHLAAFVDSRDGLTRPTSAV